MYITHSRAIVVDFESQIQTQMLNDVFSVKSLRVSCCQCKYTHIYNTYLFIDLFQSIYTQVNLNLSVYIYIYCTRKYIYKLLSLTNALICTRILRIHC